MRTWDRNKLIYLRNKYKRLLNNNDDPELELGYQSTLNSINTLLSRPSLLDINIVKYGEMVDADLELINCFGMYCPIIRDFDRLFDEYQISNLDLGNVKISEKSLFRVTEDFFASTNSELYSIYKKVAREFSTNLRFYKVKKNGTKAGQTYAIYNTGINYFEIGITDTMSDYVSLAHECGHGINNKVNRNILCDYNKYNFLEADAIFLELINNDFVGSNLSYEKDSYFVKLITLKDYLYSCDLICTKLDLYSELRGHDRYDKSLVKKRLKDESFNKVYIHDVLTTYMHEMFHYVISYLTAIELYMIYKEDKKEAFKLYKMIRDVKGLSAKGYLEYVRSIGIDPGSNIEKYVSELIDIDKKGVYIRAKKI